MFWPMMFRFASVSLLCHAVIAVVWEDLNLPEEHIPYYFSNNPAIKQECIRDDQCPYQELAKVKKCWGYEESCPEEYRMLNPDCFEQPKSLRAWMDQYKAKSHEEVYWKQADFGFIKERLDEMKTYCEPRNAGGSSLQCSKYFRFCRAKNIFMDFRRHEFKNERYSEDVFQEGEIGGYCDLDKVKLQEQNEHKSPLQSWFGELQYFSELKSDPFESGECDIIEERPTILMKLDAGVNMYHHFCDYVNLYLTQHGLNDFSQDINIVNWDTSAMNYGDFFSVTWEVFSNYPMRYLREYKNKKVCFRNAVFPLLARMRYGLYYNTPLISGCKDSSLFRAFQQHVLHRLGVVQAGPLKKKIRVTLLSRGTKYRRILNEDEIVKALSADEEYEFQVVNYNYSVTFKKQLETSMNSDIFMAMHGAGLTHLLFQPDWGAVFEIYNCEDVNCYKDLAHLRGLKYFTWENTDLLVQEDEGHHPTLGAHKKFTNYSFNVEEFLRIVKQMVTYVKQHPSFRAARRLKYYQNSDDKDDNSIKQEL